MAYMNQEKKKKIAAVLKAVMPKDWKYSLAVHDHSSLEMNIKSAPISADDIVSTSYSGLQLNEYHPQNTFKGDALAVVNAAIDALNTGNHDNSDIQSDYFDVGHYIGINFGKYDKPFVNTADVVLNAAKEVEVGDFVARQHGFGNTVYKVAEILANTYKVRSPEGNGAMLFAKEDLELRGKGYV